jgi:drug/metabolite transporter (DMT)-like permease
LFYVLPIYLGVQLGVPGGTTSLIAALQPLVVAAVAGPLLGERVGRAQAIGLVLGLVGVAVVVSADLAGSAGGGWAYLLPIAATLSLSAGTVLGRRRPATSALASLTIHTAVTALGMLIIAGIAGDLQPPMTTGFWLAVGWCGGLSGLGAYGAYLFVLRQQGATAVSSWLYLTPPTTVLWIWLMFGQPVTAVTVLGLLITAVGVVLAIRRRRARPTVLCGAALCGTPAQPKRPVM